MGESLAGSDNIAVAIVFAVLGSIIGSFIEFLLDNFRIPIPYTVMVFYVGVIIGFTIQIVGVNTGDFFTLSSLSSDLIFFGFLPTLLFSEAMNLNIHHLFQFFNQGALLAGPGALISCLILGSFTKAILPYGWSWEYAFLFASILCATDTVGVVTLLKSTKASSKLTMIVAGESLLNDGSAILMYLIFENLIDGVTFNAETIIEFVLEMLVVSPLLGFAFGFITARLMRRFTSTLTLNIDVQIGLSFCCAYASFFVASYVLEISGILCCVAAGLMISLFAPIRVVEEEKFHLMWHRAEWVCNTLIFLLAGFIGGSKASVSVNPESVLYLIIMFFILILTRFLMIFILFPVLNWVGTEKMTVHEALFATYAGLRGALGIALALEAANHAEEDDDGDNNDVGHQLFFLVTGLASLTLLINGSTAGMLLVHLKLVDDPNAPISTQLAQVLLRIKLFMHKLLREELVTMKEELGEYDELLLYQLCSMVNINVLPQLLDHKLQRQKSVVSPFLTFFSTEREEAPSLGVADGMYYSADEETGIPAIMKSSPSQLSLTSRIRSSGGTTIGGGSGRASHGVPSTHDESSIIQERLFSRISGSNEIDRDLITFIRQTFIDVIRARYTHSLHIGKIGSGSIASRLLFHSTDVAIDYIHSHINDWETIKRYMQPNYYLLSMCQVIDDFFSHFDIYPGWVSRHDSFYERLAMYILTNYIDAHEYAQSRMHFFLGGPLIKEFNITGPEEAMVMRESERLVKECKKLLATFPEDDLQKVYTHRAAKMLTQKQMEVVTNIVKEGVLSEKNAQHFFVLLQEESDCITLEIHAHMKDMMQRTIKSKISTERHIRQHVRKQQQQRQQQPYDDELGGTIISPIVGGGEAGYAEEQQQRPSFRKNLTGQDNVERLSNMMSTTRPSITSNPYQPRPSLATTSSHRTMEEGQQLSEDDSSSISSRSVVSGQV